MTVFVCSNCKKEYGANDYRHYAYDTEVTRCDECHDSDVDDPEE